MAEDLLRRHRQIDSTTEYRRLNIRSNMTGQVTTTLVKRNTRHKTQARPTVDSNPSRFGRAQKTPVAGCAPKKRGQYGNARSAM